MLKSRARKTKIRGLRDSANQAYMNCAIDYINSFHSSPLKYKYKVMRRKNKIRGAIKGKKELLDRVEEKKKKMLIKKGIYRSDMVNIMCYSKFSCTYP